MADYISRRAAILAIRRRERENEKWAGCPETLDICTDLADAIDAIKGVKPADVRPVVKCLECENALRDDSHKIVHCNQNGEPGYVWCKKEGCCRAEDFFCANGVSCSCGAGMREVKADG